MIDIKFLRAEPEAVRENIRKKFQFDKLPLVQDAGILKNILCAGLWAQFNKKYKKEETDGTGSV